MLLATPSICPDEPCSHIIRNGTHTGSEPGRVPPMSSPFSRWRGDGFLPRLTLLLLLFLHCICCGVSTYLDGSPPPWCPLTPRSPPSCVLVPLGLRECAEADAVVRGERTPQGLGGDLGPPQGWSVRSGATTGLGRQTQSLDPESVRPLLLRCLLPTRRLRRQKGPLGTERSLRIVNGASPAWREPQGPPGGTPTSQPPESSMESGLRDSCPPPRVLPL